MEGGRSAVQDRRLTAVNKIFADLPNTIFDVMSQAARDLNAINLGQGFPEDPGPLDVRQKAADAVLNGYNQYPSMMGIPELRQAIATHYAHWHGLQLDPMSEVMVTSGATEALTGSILGLVQPGDEVLLFQPMYDSYVPIIRLAGGVNAIEGYSGYRPLTPEAVIASKADYILVTRQTVEAMGGIQAVLDQPSLNRTPAGKAGKVLEFDALLLLGFGPRTPQAAQELASALHPELARAP